jgi:hypothetical protein
MAGTIITDVLQAASTSQLNIKNGVALTPPTISDVNNVQIGTFCRAWVNFNGTFVGNMTIANGGIRASFNVSSITDVAVGVYVVNMTNAMPSINYNVSASVSGNSGDQFGITIEVNRHFTAYNIAPTTTAFYLITQATGQNNAYRDCDYVLASVFN